MMNGGQKSDSAIAARKPPNGAGPPAEEAGERRAEAEGNAGQFSTRPTQGRETVSHGLDRVRQAAQARKEERFTALLHHVDTERLRDTFQALKRKAAPGVDGLTWQDYEAGLEHRLVELHERIHKGADRPHPSRRVMIPKADGTQRPLAIAALEDKIVQGAVATVLSAISEEDFLGSRPGSGPHAEHTMRGTLSGSRSAAGR